MLLNGFDLLALVLLVMCLLIVGGMWFETRKRRSKLNSYWPR